MPVEHPSLARVWSCTSNTYHRLSTLANICDLQMSIAVSSFCQADRKEISPPTAYAHLRQVFEYSLSGMIAFEELFVPHHPSTLCDIAPCCLRSSSPSGPFSTADRHSLVVGTFRRVRLVSSARLQRQTGISHTLFLSAAWQPMACIATTR